MKKAQKEAAQTETSEAQNIWKEIKRLPIEIFGLPNQYVEKYAEPIFLPGNDLYLKLKVPAALPALETSLDNSVLTRGKKYQLDMGEKYLRVSRVPTSIA